MVAMWLSFMKLATLVSVDTNGSYGIFVHDREKQAERPYQSGLDLHRSFIFSYVSTCAIPKAEQLHFEITLSHASVRYFSATA